MAPFLGPHPPEPSADRGARLALHHHVDLRDVHRHPDAHQRRARHQHRGHCALRLPHRVQVVLHRVRFRDRGRHARSELRVRHPLSALVEGARMTTRAASRAARPTAAPRGASWIETVAVHLVFGAVVLFFLVPFLWLFTSAFDADAVAYIRLPAKPTLDNFVRIFSEHDFGRALANSVIVAGATMILDVAAVSLAGYSLSRMDLRFKSWITYAVLLLQTMPLSATMVPIYGLARTLGLRNSYLGLILIHAAIELPFLIWLMKGFFDGVPRSLEEAAWLDGRSKLRALVEVVLPVARNGIGVVAGLSFLAAWAEVLMVIILVDRQDMFTVPLAFYQVLRTRGGYTEVQYRMVAAMGVLYLVPVMVIFFATRRMMVRGLLSSARGL